MKRLSKWIMLSTFNTPLIESIIAFKVIENSLKCLVALSGRQLLECARECSFVYITCCTTYRMSSFKVLLNLFVFISRCEFILENT